MGFDDLHQDLQDNWDGQDVAVPSFVLLSSFILLILFILTILIRTHSWSASGFTG